MAPTLPSSLSPHICVLPSKDLLDLLGAASLPSLPHILQSFSPLPQVTTRTTSLASVNHSSFALRFSDLTEIEAACREDEAQRAIRTLDWIGSRIQKRCGKWVEDMEKIGDPAIPRTPWWDELKRCAEGDHVPSKSEAWNHPVAIILAVSTMSPNPLQAITALHAQNIDLPSWVDPTSLRYTLIIHTKDSALSDEEAGALFNAVKKQFGLHSYLLTLTLPSPPPPPVPVPAPLPRLPPPYMDTSSADATAVQPTLHTLSLSDQDIQQTNRFVREFVVMSLLPWMEKCTMEWNENFSSNRRLPSRLFSSTRRLFGTPSPSPTPTHNTSSSVSSLPSRTMTMPNYAPNGGNQISPPSQQRRLAEFATILGDFKLAVTVWEALRKEAKGGSDILPLLLAPSPTLPLHASNSLASLHHPSADPPPHAQLRALLYAVRWETGTSLSDFIGNILEGERWLVWAAGSAEEMPSALLLGHAALLSSKKHARRRAAYWYLSAANRLEKCGIKPLTMYFLRRAHDLSRKAPPKSLSPLFWESEGKSPSDVDGFDAVMSGIEHPLGRLLYTTGDVAGAVRLLLGLLKQTHPPYTAVVPTEAAPTGTDKLYLDDFRVAFAHFKSTVEDKSQLYDLKLPFTLCVPRKTTVRLGGENAWNNSEHWQQRQDIWKAFWKGKEQLITKEKAAVNETLWVDLVLQNPLDTEVSLSNLTLQVCDSKTKEPLPFVKVEVIEDIVLASKELRTVSISIKSSQPANFLITRATYDFLSLLPTSEALASRGRRLHATPAQRSTPTYSPEVSIAVEVVEKTHTLLANFVDDDYLTLAQGETRAMTLWFSNEGPHAISELWVIPSLADEVWLGVEDEPQPAHSNEVFKSQNSLGPQRPMPIPLGNKDGSSALPPGDTMSVPIILHATNTGDQELQLFFIYRGDSSQDFYVVRAMRTFEVQPLFRISLTAQPSRTVDCSFALALEVANTSSVSVRLSQITLVGPRWLCHSEAKDVPPIALPLQNTHFHFGANPWLDGHGSKETEQFVSRKLADVLQGRTVEVSEPPPIDIVCAHMLKSDEGRYSITRNPNKHFIDSGRRIAITSSLARNFPQIPPSSYHNIFPLFNPSALDMVVFWELLEQKRTGHLYVTGLHLGAGHAALSDIVEEAKNAKAKRSMYAETERERVEMLNAVENSEWNMEMNPLTLVVQGLETVVHNFADGPISVWVFLAIRNHSLTHRAKFVLRLHSKLASDGTSDSLPPPYSGRTRFRGNLDPGALTTVRACLWITQPGIYSLGVWQLETEVEPLMNATSNTHTAPRLYSQEAGAGDRTCLVVKDMNVA